jgi:hypothetical protein
MVGRELVLEISGGSWLDIEEIEVELSRSALRGREEEEPVEAVVDEE